MVEMPIDSLWIKDGKISANRPTIHTEQAPDDLIPYGPHNFVRLSHRISTDGEVHTWRGVFIELDQKAIYSRARQNASEGIDHAPSTGVSRVLTYEDRTGPEDEPASWNQN